MHTTLSAPKTSTHTCTASFTYRGTCRSYLARVAYLPSSPPSPEPTALIWETSQQEGHGKNVVICLSIPEVRSLLTLPNRAVCRILVDRGGHVPPVIVLSARYPPAGQLTNLACPCDLSLTLWECRLRHRLRLVSHKSWTGSSIRKYSQGLVFCVYITCTLAASRRSQNLPYATGQAIPFHNLTRLPRNHAANAQPWRLLTRPSSIASGISTSNPSSPLVAYTISTGHRRNTSPSCRQRRPTTPIHKSPTTSSLQHTYSLHSQRVS